MLLVSLLACIAVVPDAVVTARLDRLLVLHKEYGLPLPPPDAQLVQFASENYIGYPARWARKHYDPPFPGIGFSLDGRTVLGNFNESSPVDFIACIKPDPTVLDESVDLADLTLAMQCHARGWTALSREVYRCWRSQYLESRDPEWATDEQYLASIAWEHWRFRLNHDPGSALSAVAKHMKRLLPVLDPGGEFKSDHELLRSLDMALAPQNSKPGSDAALIDHLIEVHGDCDSSREIMVLRTHTFYEDAFRTDPRYRALVRRGFAAVPTLIDYLGDERLTRVVRRVNLFNMSYDLYHLRVKDVALDVLQEFAGEPFVNDDADFLKRSAAARGWFAQVRNLGEEQYVKSGVIRKEKEREWINDTLFWLLCEKYPKRLPEVYRDLIDKHSDLDYSSWEFARAVAQGPLPVAEKQRVLEYAASQTNPNHRAAGVKYLRNFDPKRADELLLAALDRLPSKVSWDDLPLVELAAQRNRPEEWRALGLAVRRAETESRIGLLKVIGEETAAESGRARLALLTEYLTDDALCDKTGVVPKPIPYDIADTGFRRLEVRNFAALQLAKSLQFNDEPHDGWTVKDWADLRNRVRATIRKELSR